MRGIKLCVLVIFILSLFQLSLYSLITSRVEGTVIDEENNEPILDAKVLLYNVMTESSSRLIATMYTNSKGYFKVDDILKGEYFLLVYKTGYAAIGHIVDLEKQRSQDPNELIKPPVKDGRFYLKEGQIKHFKIEMEKEAVLKVEVTKKVPFGTSTVFQYSTEMYFKHPAYDDKIGVNFTEHYQSKYLKEGTIDVTIYSDGYPPQTYEVQLEKGKTKTINHILDFTKGQVVYGVLKYKDNGMPVWGAPVNLTKIDEKSFWVEANADKNGKYWVGGLKPGTYSVWISQVFQAKDYRTTITVNPGERKELSLFFEKNR